MTKTNRKSRKNQVSSSTFGVLPAATPAQMERYTSTGALIVSGATYCRIMHSSTCQCSKGSK